MDDIHPVMQRKARDLSLEDLLRLLDGLELSDPHRRAGHLHREVIDFHPMELVETHLDGRLLDLVPGGEGLHAFA